MILTNSPQSEQIYNFWWNERTSPVRKNGEGFLNCRRQDVMDGRNVQIFRRMTWHVTPSLGSKRSHSQRLPCTWNRHFLHWDLGPTENNNSTRIPFFNRRNYNNSTDESIRDSWRASSLRPWLTLTPLDKLTVLEASLFLLNSQKSE